MSNKLVLICICFFYQLTAINQVVIPAAGLGTRFLPITKVIPKELLPIGSRAALELILQEVHYAGCTHAGIVISDQKQMIGEYTRDHLLGLNVHCLFQTEMKGLGHAILMAQEYIQNDYFGVILPDMIFMQNDSALGQLISVANKYSGAIIGVQKVLPDQVHHYGIIEIKKQMSINLFELKGIVEKPTPEQAPSCYAVMGRYILPKTIFENIKTVTPDKNNEIQLTHAIAQLIAQGQPVYACVLDGSMFDIGQPAGWLAANNFTARGNYGLYDTTTTEHNEYECTSR